MISAKSTISLNNQTLNFAIESYDRVAEEIKMMLPAHWQELAVYKDIPLDPDYDLYRTLDRAGILKIFTARLDSELIGYSIFVVKRHPHYRGHSWAMNDIVWVHPSHRSAGVGGAFVLFWDAQFRHLGVDVVHVNAKVAEPALMYCLKSCGYATVECGLEKRLS